MQIEKYFWDYKKKQSLPSRNTGETCAFLCTKKRKFELCELGTYVITLWTAFKSKLACLIPPWVNFPNVLCITPSERQGSNEQKKSNGVTALDTDLLWS